MALIRLDEQPSPDEASPLHPPSVPFACDYEFTGFQVGYAWSPGFFPLEGLCSNQLPVRRISSSSTWVDPTIWDVPYTSENRIFSTSWFGIESEICNWYGGIAPGDSGGALVDDAGRLCGVLSEVLPLLLIPGAGQTSVWEVTNRHPATDSPETIDWIESFIIDEFGCYEGECCETPNSENDPDGDGIVTRCDLCPLVATPPGAPFPNLDTDEDGIGDWCDQCPGLNLPFQGDNANIESELALFYERAGLGYTSTLPSIAADGIYIGPVLARAFVDQADFIETLADYQAIFKPDACDPFPNPSTDIDEGDLADGDYPIVSDPIAECPQFNKPCEFYVHNNLSVRVPPSTVVSPNNTATVGLRWCDCPDFPAGSLTGREACANNPNFQCEIGDTQGYLLPDSPWLRIHTNESGWANPSDLGKEWQGSTDGTLVTAPLRWDFIPLASDPDDPEVDGVLWTHVRDEDSGLLEPLTVRELANGYGDGAAYLSFGSPGRLWVVVNENPFCRDCEYQITDIVASLINPAFATVTPSGLRQVLDLDEDTVTYFDQLLARELFEVSVSEPMVVQQHFTTPGTLMTRAVGFDASGSVQKLVQMTDPLALPSAEDYRIITLPPDTSLAALNAGPGPFEPSSAALSGTLGTLFVLDGDHGWTLDLRTGTWRSVSFPPEEATSGIVAAGYRHQDRAVYFLEADDMGRLTLRRWNALRRFPEDGAVETVAELPSGWHCDERCWVSFDERGSLLVSLANPGKGVRGKSFVLSWFDFTDGDVLLYRGRVRAGGEVLSRPKLFPDAAVITYATGQAPEQRVYSLEDFKDAGAAPTLLVRP